MNVSRIMARKSLTAGLLVGSLKWSSKHHQCCSMLCSMQLEEEQSIKNASIWAMKEYYANYTLLLNDTEATPPPMDPSDVIRGPCWETAVGVVMEKKNKCSRVILKISKSKVLLLSFEWRPRSL